MHVHISTPSFKMLPFAAVKTLESDNDVTWPPTLSDFLLSDGKGGRQLREGRGSYYFIFLDGFWRCQETALFKEWTVELHNVKKYKNKKLAPAATNTWKLYCAMEEMFTKDTFLWQIINSPSETLVNIQLGRRWFCGPNRPFYLCSRCDQLCTKRGGRSTVTKSVFTVACWPANQRGAASGDLPLVRRFNAEYWGEQKAHFTF